MGDRHMENKKSDVFGRNNKRQRDEDLGESDSEDNYSGSESEGDYMDMECGRWYWEVVFCKTLGCKGECVAIARKDYDKACAIWIPESKGHYIKLGEKGDRIECDYGRPNRTNLRSNANAVPDVGQRTSMLQSSSISNVKLQPAKEPETKKPN